MNEFVDKKISVCNSVLGLKEFLNKHKGVKFCLYLGYKDKEEWDKSTSRVYMNQVLPELIYVPVSIQKNDNASLKSVYEIAAENDNIVAINQTQPHKSNPVLKEFFKGENLPANVDALIKDKNKKFQLFDLNGPSFVGWFKDEVSILAGKIVIIFGVGGVGEPIARRISTEKLSSLILIDLVSKNELKEELSEAGEVVFLNNLKDIKISNHKNIVFINCAGKEGADDSLVAEVLQKYGNENNIFVDLRPYLDIDIVSRAKDLGWRSYTGHGMNARNDYTLLSKIAEIINMTPPSFAKFKEMVAKAS